MISRGKLDSGSHELGSGCNAYALRGSSLGANLASNLHGTLVGKRETWTWFPLEFVEES